MLQVVVVGDVMQVDMLCVVGVSKQVGNDIFGMEGGMYEYIGQLLQFVLLFMGWIIIQIYCWLWLIDQYVVFIVGDKKIVGSWVVQCLCGL